MTAGVRHPSEFGDPRSRSGRSRALWRGQQIAVLAVAALAMGGCASDDAVTPAESTAPSVAAPEGPGTADDDLDLSGQLAGKLVITRQRDLIDRGLINVRTTNSTGHRLTILDRRLVADHFEIPPAPDRISTIGDGGTVALQVPYGTAIDCVTDTPVEAHLQLSVSIDGSTEVVRADVRLDGSDILDGIRARHCARQVFDVSTDVRFDDVVVDAANVDGEAVATELIITNTSDESTFVIDRVSSTILVAANVSTASSVSNLPSVPIRIAPGDTVSLPVVFTVIRCDPHALAEVTKRYGLDLRVAVDDEPAQVVAIDVSELADDLELSVERCHRRQP